VETVTPLTLEVALAVQKELESRDNETDRPKNLADDARRGDAGWDNCPPVLPAVSFLDLRVIPAMSTLRLSRWMKNST
jgi:hypothetical protein